MSQLEYIQSPLEWGEISRYLGRYAGQIKRHAVHAELTSTNDWALQQAADFDLLPAVCLAESQSMGRGRRGRRWASPNKSNIYMSLVWPFGKPITELGALSLVVGVSVAKVLEAYGLRPRLKWPNDVLVSGRKIAGILIESRIQHSTQSAMVIGLGLNVAMDDAQGRDIEQPWTHFLDEYRGEAIIDRNRLSAELINQLMIDCRMFEAEGFSVFRQAWNQLDVCNGQRVEVTTDSGGYLGEALGVDEQGAIIVRIDGEDRVFHTAEISLRLQK